jgi:hypothetical protein
MALQEAAPSNELICGLSLAGIEGLNPAGSVDVFPFRVLHVVRRRSLRRADHSSRGVYLVWWVQFVCSRTPVEGGREPEWGHGLTRKREKIKVCAIRWSVSGVYRYTFYPQWKLQDSSETFQIISTNTNSWNKTQ